MINTKNKVLDIDEKLYIGLDDTFRSALYPILSIDYLNNIQLKVNYHLYLGRRHVKDYRMMYNNQSVSLITTKNRLMDN